MPEPSLPIALDAMGGDHAPAAAVRGAALAVRELGVRVALVGRRADVERQLATLPPEDGAALPALSVVDAAEVVAMDEHPAGAVRSKRHASINVACRELAEGRARAVVSAGNSGAVLAAALLGVKRLAGVARPAIGALIPGPGEHRTFLLDVGANTDCKPEWLAQFAVMGSVYATAMLGVANPRVALLSNGEERGKGNELVQAADPLLAAIGVNFAGNAEGKDLFSGAVDVLVCDGFAGNVALKVAEGVAEFLFASISTAARTSLQGRLGGALLKPRLRPLRDQVDYRRTGGALLLGVAGEVVIAHGRSDALAIMNALRVADQAAQRDVSGIIGRRLAISAPAADRPATTKPSPQPSEPSREPSTA
ncbi:MAG TPA: phosphate acyltransferase PlsX [Candidatus Dormibacteraeota bacterium]